MLSPKIYKIQKDLLGTKRVDQASPHCTSILGHLSAEYTENWRKR